MTDSKIVATLVLAAGLAAGPGTARAQSTAEAETLFRQGKELLAAGKIADACAAFDASEKLEPTVATVLNQASCREKNGQLATAWGLFLEAQRQARGQAGDAARQLRQVAIDHAAKLEPRLSTLTITVAAENRVAGLEILRNGEPVDPGAWNKPLPVDGGSYRITARAPGNAAWSSTITVGAERDAGTIEPPRLKAAALPASQGAAASAPPAASGSRSPASPRWVPLVLGGGALVLGGGALGFELSARSIYDRSRHEPDNARQDALWHSANTRRYVAEGLGAAGLACAGVAIFLYLRAGEPETAAAPAEARRWRIMPTLSTSHAGLALEGRY